MGVYSTPTPPTYRTTLMVGRVRGAQIFRKWGGGLPRGASGIHLYDGRRWGGRGGHHVATRGEGQAFQLADKRNGTKTSWTATRPAQQLSRSKFERTSDASRSTATALRAGQSNPTISFFLSLSVLVFLCRGALGRWAGVGRARTCACAYRQRIRSAHDTCGRVEERQRPLLPMNGTLNYVPGACWDGH